MKTILLTGGAGFIGFHTAKKLLQKRYKVILIDNLNDYYSPKLKKDRLKQIESEENLKIHKIDIANLDNLKKLFKENEVEIICHLAAQPGVRYSFENPEAYHQSNVKGTFNLLELAREYKIKKFVFASSSSVYGNSQNEAFLETDNTDKPISLYAATKKAGELLIHYYHDAFGLNVIALRFFTVYGPWGRPDMAYYKFSKSILDGKTIDVYNKGRHQRDFTYIDDIVEGIIKSIEFEQNDPYFEVVNLGNSKPVELEYFIGTLEKFLSKKADKNYLPMQPGDVLKTSANIDKAKRLLNWQPTTSIEQGLKKFVAWFKEYNK